MIQYTLRTRATGPRPRREWVGAAVARGDIDLKGELMAWLVLTVAGLFEVAWAVGLRYTEGFTRLWPSVWTLTAMALSVWLLGLAMRTLPMGTAYSVWVGIGAAGTVLVGIVLLGESADAGRLISVTLIIAGVVGLKLATPA